MGKASMTAVLLRELYQGSPGRAQKKVAGEIKGGGTPFVAPGIRELIGFDMFDAMKGRRFPRRRRCQLAYADPGREAGTVPQGAYTRRQGRARAASRGWEVIKKLTEPGPRALGHTQSRPPANFHEAAVDRMAVYLGMRRRTCPPPLFQRAASTHIAGPGSFSCAAASLSSSPGKSFTTSTTSPISEALNLRPSWNIAPTQEAGSHPAGRARPCVPADALGPCAVLGQGSQHRQSGDQREGRDGGGEAGVPRRLEIAALPRAGERLLRVARSGRRRAGAARQDALLYRAAGTACP